MKVDVRFISTLMSVILVLLILVLSGALAVATFIENDFGPESARAAVYEAVWFQGIGLFALLLFTLIFLFRKPWQKGKRFALVFYAGILFIYLGYGVTQYIGYHGLLHLREGEVSSQIETSNSFLQIHVKKGHEEILWQKPLLYSPMIRNILHQTIHVGNKTLNVRCLNHFQNGAGRVTEDPQGVPIFLVQVAGRDGIRSVLLQEKETWTVEGTVIGFRAEIPDSLPGIQIQTEGDRFVFSTTQSMTVRSTADGHTRTVSPNKEMDFAPFHVYEIGSLKLELEQYCPAGRIEAVDLSDLPGFEPERPDRQDVLVVEIRIGEEKKQAVLFCGTNGTENIRHVRMKDCEIDLSYGSKKTRMPFAIQLLDFHVERYPGSQQPSGFVSNVVVRDSGEKIQMPYRIYMNHILKYRGYRFIQFSYDEDEAGSVLSVSYDPGTPIFYAGYALLLLSCIVNLFRPNGRFRLLGKKIRELSSSRFWGTVVFILLLSIVFPAAGFSESGAEEPLRIARQFDLSHCRKFGMLLIQDQSGRIKPLDSHGREIMHGLSRPDKVLDLHPDQIVLGLMVRPSLWLDMPVIKIGHPEINILIGIDPSRKWATYNECFVEPSGQFKLTDEYRAAQSKAPRLRTRLDKTILNLQKRVAILEQALDASHYRLFPITGNPSSPWRAIDRDTMWLAYEKSIREALKENDWNQAEKALSKMFQYQKEKGSGCIPGENRIRAEIFYNKCNLSGRLVFWVLVLGGVLLIVSVGRMFLDWPLLDELLKVLTISLLIAFVIQTVDLGLRWYVSGHAPWSNQYESMVYTAWTLMLAGWILSRRNSIPLATASFVSGMVLKTAHSFWVDPQITLLPPVLKSHWMLTHVSIIISSYGFLGLSAVLGLICLLFFIFKTRKSARCIDPAIQSLTWISEKSILLGYVLVLAGTFLGSVWANESWGRYWGWDPKETWTLIVILVYSVVVHLHSVPGIYSSFLFNVSSFLAFSTILMTYIGVNFYLSGLHSYASGDPLPIPIFFYVMVILIAVVIALAFPKRKLFNFEDREKRHP